MPKRPAAARHGLTLVLGTLLPGALLPGTACFLDARSAAPTKMMFGENIRLRGAFAQNEPPSAANPANANNLVADYRGWSRTPTSGRAASSSRPTAAAPRAEESNCVRVT